MTDFRKDLAALINRHSLENGSDTPDFILADFLAGCLALWDANVSARTGWYAPRNPPPAPPATPAQDKEERR